MLISTDYRAQQKKMHVDIPSYGTSSHQYAGVVSDIINKVGVTEVLDYGCGKGTLAKTINPAHKVKLIQYDPCIEGLSDTPDSAQMTVCTDVLEHIEPDLLDNVLDDLQRVTEIIGFWAIHTGPAVKILPDGRNAHLIQEDQRWWLPKIMERMEIIGYQKQPQGFYVVVQPWQ
jgi:hypothetical protein